ncbi:MAG: sulfurtransferase TusA family protein, partial [Acidobacteriota bacterium]
MKRIDVRNLACPGPVLKLRDLLEAGEREIAMHVADELSRSNVARFAASRGADVEVAEGDDGSFVLAIRAGGSAAEARPGEKELLTCEVPEPTVSAGRRVVQITAATMGSGDDELGSILLRSFLKTQAELERKPDAIVFYNDGVKLWAPASTSSSSAINCASVAAPICSRSPACWPMQDRSCAHERPSHLPRPRGHFFSQGSWSGGGDGPFSQRVCGQPGSRRAPVVGGRLARHRGCPRGGRRAPRRRPGTDAARS